MSVLRIIHHECADSYRFVKLQRACVHEWRLLAFNRIGQGLGIFSVITYMRPTTR